MSNISFETILPFTEINALVTGQIQGKNTKRTLVLWRNLSMAEKSMVMQQFLHSGIAILDHNRDDILGAPKKAHYWSQTAENFSGLDPVSKSRVTSILVGTQYAMCRIGGSYQPVRPAIVSWKSPNATASYNTYGEE